MNSRRFSATMLLILVSVLFSIITIPFALGLLPFHKYLGIPTQVGYFGVWSLGFLYIALSVSIVLWISLVGWAFYKILCYLFPREENET